LQAYFVIPEKFTFSPPPSSSTRTWLPLRFSGYDDFERRIIKAPYAEHQLSSETEEKLCRQFKVHIGIDGATFTRAVGIRLLRKAHIV
jgi:hypothetical protein